MPMTLADLRRLSGFYLTVLLWLHVPLTGAIYLLGGAGGVMVPACVALLAAVAQIEYRRNPTGKGAALTFAIALAVIVALMVFQLQGSAWQTDLHMYFFATFAMMSVFCDWRPIVAFAGVVAVHHLGLNFLMTSAVFPGEADLGRVVLHAAVLITQAVVMLGLNLVLARMFGATEAALAAAEASREVTERLNAQRDLVEQEQRHAMRVIEAAMNDLARGDLQARVKGTAAEPFPEAYAVLRTSFNTVAETFSETIGTFEANAREMLETADRIAEAADATSRGVESQKSTLTGSANSLRQITQSVAVTSELAVKAEDEMQANRCASEEGGSVLLSAVGAMGRIEKSSGEIHRIVEVIEDIAFQTNLLALNAGVEAGRAGDAGKGFAVVATEVRALAQRASASAKDIRKRIEESRAFVAEGCILVERTSEALSKVIDRTATVAGIMSEINQRVSQQTADLRSIMGDVSVIERESQLAAQEAESSREIAARISGQADHLISTLEVFALPTTAAAPGRVRLAG